MNAIMFTFSLKRSLKASNASFLSLKVVLGSGVLFLLSLLGLGLASKLSSVEDL